MNSNAPNSCGNILTLTPPPDNSDPTIPVNLFFRNQMTTQHDIDENNLNKIISDHVKPTDGRHIKLHIYYKNRHLQQLLIKNNPHISDDESHVVYKYVCPQEECQPLHQYIGYTTNPLKKHMTIDDARPNWLNY